MRYSRIAILTDFGLTDIYVGVMHGVIASIAPDAKVVDLCHGIPRQDLAVASQMLSSSVEYFPADTLFLVVVDPGVGSSRRILYAQSDQGGFVAPDNGVLFSTLQSLRNVKLFDLNQSDYWLTNVSNTFHGRDIFAPCAAHLSRGVKPENMGSRIDKGVDAIVKLTTVEPVFEVNKITLTVTFIDIYGNITLNLSKPAFPDWLAHSNVQLKTSSTLITTRLHSSYTAVEVGKPLLILNSFESLELAMNHENAAKQLQLSLGSTLILTPQ